MCKDLKNIILKKGDIVYFDDNSQTRILLDCQVDDIEKPNIIKIERPIKYETIYEKSKQILTKEEKEYLENVVRPFRKEIETIISKKVWNDIKEYIYIKLRLWANPVMLPCFDNGTMYKGMELNKEYTLEELGLFE